MIHYSVDIRFREVFIRVATKRIVANFEGDGCSTAVKLPYLPKVISIDPITLESSLDGPPPVPTVKISIADASREYIATLRSANPEEALVVVRMLDSTNHSDEVIMVGRGYMTDVEWEAGVLKMTVRGELSFDSEGEYPLYSFDSFQYFEVIAPAKVGLGADIEVNDTTPWRVFKAELKRTFLAEQVFNVDAVDFYSYHTPLPIPTTVDIKTRNGSVIPGSDFIKLATEVNAWTKYLVTTEDVDAGDLGELVGDETYLKPTILPLFSQASPGNYQYAIIGNSESGSQEVIAYTHCLQAQIRPTSFASAPVVDVNGTTAYFLSGIPVTPSFDNDLDDSAYDPANKFATLAEKKAFASEFGIKYEHRPGEIIAPRDAVDRLWINAGNLIPRYDNDVDLSVGLLWAGRSLLLNNVSGNVLGRPVKLFSRYVIKESHEDIYDDVNRSGVIPHVLLLEIHNRALSPTHEWALSGSAMISGELPSEISMDTKLSITRMNYMVRSIDIHLGQMDIDLYNYIKGLVESGRQPEGLLNRYRGKRFDTIRSLAEMNVTLQSAQLNGSTSYESDTLQQQNESLVNNAGEKFAVATSSEFVIENFILYERVNFAGSGEYASINVLLSAGKSIVARRIGFVYEGDSFDDTASDEYIIESSSNEAVWSNYMKYWPTYQEAQKYLVEGGWETLSGVWEDLSRDYFEGARYRVIHDPVPENGTDIGKMFPIVYGRVERVPLIQAISSKAMSEDELTAGDDLYIYASHPCDVKRSASIKLEWFPDNDGLSDIATADLFDATLKREIVETPFPTKLSGHFVTEQVGDTDTFELVLQGDIICPYHKLENYTTLDGTPVYGVRLRGAEWDSKAGRFDKRYPIRNGLGSTTLFASFSGYESIDSKLISHPVDVVKHYVRTYGKFPFNVGFVDESQLDRIKSATSFYTASIFLNEPLSVADMINKISEQFGYMMFLYDGKIRLAVPSSEFADLTKPIAYGYNLMEGVIEDTEGYKDIYTRIEYKYQKNWVSGKYDKELVLHPENNRYCSLAAASKGQKKVLKIEADFVRSTLVATDVVNRYATLLSGIRKKLNFSVRYVEGVTFSPGDVVAMSYPDFDMVQEPVLIMKVVYGRYFMTIEAFRIGGLEDAISH